MTKGQRTIAGLLTAVVVLLGLNLAATMTTRTAHAQPGYEIPPRVIGVTTAGSDGFHFVYRLWADGTLERIKWCVNCNNQWSSLGWTLVPE